MLHKTSSASQDGTTENQPILDDLLVVIRGIGERTEEAAAALAETIVGPNHVTHVTGAPFSVTLKKSFEAAIESSLPWVCCIDADILPLPAALLHLRRTVQCAPSSILGIHGYIVDKFFGGLRPAGTRIYRTELLKKAVIYIPDGEISKRPETYVRRAMQQKGYEWLTHGILSGLHDFEQYYRDIYRTAFFHAQKHRKYVPTMLPYWERMSTKDSDFLVALKGVEDGLKEEHVLGLDVRNFSERTDRVLQDLNLIEKKPLTTNVVELKNMIEHTMLNWDRPQEYDHFWHQTREPSRIAKLLGPKMLKRLGLNSLPEE